MSQRIYVRYQLSTLLLLVAVNASDAESVLLGHVYQSSTQTDDEGNLQFDFFLNAAAGPTNQVRLSKMPTTADIGKTFPADAATLEKFNEILTKTPGTVGMDSGLGIFGTERHFVADEFFNGPFMGEIPPVTIPESNAFVVKAFVPQRGPNFTGYRITSMDQTIHGFSVRQGNPSTWLYWGAQTIRLFGEQIPEPTTIIQSLLCLALGLGGTLSRHRQYS